MRGSSPPLRRTRNEWITDLGRTVRLLFFVLMSGAIYLFFRNVDWSVPDTRFADLTIRKLGDYILSVLGGAFAVWHIGCWAFSGAEKDYRCWATWGFAALAGVIGAIFWLKQP